MRPRGLAVARLAAGYHRRWLRHDVLAGLVLTSLLIPQGMAYAALAGLPPVVGLYATMVPLLVYAILGPSRILVLGPDSAVAPLVAAAVIPIAASDMGQRTALAAMLAVVAGGVMVVGAVAGFAFVTDLISKPVRLGYLAGIAVTVVVSQLPPLLGFTTEADGFPAKVRALAGGLGDTDPVALAIGLCVVTVVLALKRLEPRAPGLLLGVAGATVLVAALDLADRIDTVGSVPAGLPGLALPGVSLADLGELTGAAIAIALIAFADTSVLSRSYAAKLGDDVDQGQELLALGAANMVTGLFHGFPISGSATRTPVAEAAGARTQLTGVVAAGALAGVLAVGTPLVRDLPVTALAAVVITAVVALVDVKALTRLAHAHRTDFALAVVSFLGVTVAGVLPGVGIAVAISLAAFFWRVWHPYDATLGRVAGIKGYHDLTRYPEGRTVPGLVLFRFDAPLFFANAGVFSERLLRAVRRAPQPVRRVVVAAEPITDVDSTAAEMLAALHDELTSGGIELAFAELKDPVKDKLRRFGLVDHIGRDRFFPTLGVAVHAYASERRIAWEP
jgi:high affinity sulfate transporter 1